MKERIVKLNGVTEAFEFFKNVTTILIFISSDTNSLASSKTSEGPFQDLTGIEVLRKCPNSSPRHW